MAFSRLVQKYFSRNSTFWLVETDFLVRENRFPLFSLFLLVETVTEINGSQFLKKDHN